MLSKQKLGLSVMVVSALMIGYLLSPKNGPEVPAQQAPAQQPSEPAAPSMMSRGEFLDKAAPRRLKPGMSPKEEDAVRDRVALAFQEVYSNLGLDVDIYTWGKDPKALKIIYSKMDRNVALSFTKQFNENPQWMQALRDAGFERVIVQNVSRQALRDTNLQGYLRPNDRPFSAEYKVTDEGLVASRPSPAKVE